MLCFGCGCDELLSAQTKKKGGGWGGGGGTKCINKLIKKRRFCDAGTLAIKNLVNSTLVHDLPPNQSYIHFVVYISGKSCAFDVCRVSYCITLIIHSALIRVLGYN